MRPIELDDGAALRGMLADLGPEQSELTFTNLFIWREAYGLRLSRVGEAVAVFSRRADPEDSLLLPPLGAGANATVVRRCLEHMAENEHRAVMARATKADLTRLGVGEGEFAVEPDRDSWDYVYRVEDLMQLSGNRYHRKRNHIEQFTGRHEFTYRPLTPELVPACQELQDRWCDEKHCDLVATLRAEGRTVVIHIEKANAAFHGLYQVINQQFLEKQWSQVRYVNREQDMGVSGLRKAKESYYPDHMVEKFTVVLW